MEKNKINAASVTIHPLYRQFEDYLKNHSGEKPNKCNQCDSASSQAGPLRTHFKTHNGKNQTHASSEEEEDKSLYIGIEDSAKIIQN